VIGDQTTMLVEPTFDHVFEHFGAHARRHRRRPVQSRIRVDFQQPRLEVFGQDEVGAVQLEAVLPDNHLVLVHQDGGGYALLHPRIDRVLEGVGVADVGQVPDEVVRVPHVVTRQRRVQRGVLVLALDRVVGQVDGLVQFPQVVSLGAESQVALSET
jgi:plasmid stabilization system protein ParE